MPSDEKIVIAGIAGRFPECENVEQFKEALLKGIDLVTEDDRRHPPGIWGTPKRAGKIPTIDKFDASYFGIHAKQATFMDPRQRILNETIYECIIDAGFNPCELRGTKTGVYVGIANFTNIEELRRHDTDGYTNIGLNLALAANRASYCFDFKGPSYIVDTACSSTVYGFVNAINDMKNGKTESAVVCGTHLILHPHETLEFQNLNMLAEDGKCKVFNTVRDGYGRSESVVSILLQKESVSRRVYATVLGAKANSDGYKVEGITFPSSEMQLQLMKELYDEIGVDPNEVSYIEAHGTGTPAGDVYECESLVNMFCRNRKLPVPVGAVKSNMGHSEIASGLCSVAKALIAMETGVIPANLHIDVLDPDLPGIKDHKLQIVTKNLPWEGGIVALNSFGFGGANAHVVLKSHDAEKSKSYARPKHRLVQVSGRTEEAVNHFLDGVEANQDDEEFLALVDEIHKINVDKHNYRGYAVLGEKTQRQVDRYTKERPIWFIYTGMGSQWIGMGKDLMRIEVFRNTIRKCANALKPYNVDLEDIITNTSPTTFDDIVNCFCGIGAVEIALTDVLYSLGVIPDGFAGHSLGEVGCAYADGQITPEQAILLAYSRGYGTINTKIPPGQMAAVGLSKEECQKLLPEGIYVACQNGKDSVTISGEQQLTQAFVEELQSKGIFARLVKSAGIAYHTKHVHEAGNLLYDFCKKVLTGPKFRSPKWISTSVPENKKDLNWTRYNCAEYHHNNFCSKVLFDQVYQHIPDNAIVVEVAPHGLLQAILKRELGPDTTYISLANRSAEDNEQFLLSSIGKIFNAGGQPNLRNLYPGVSFPVSRGTKMLAPLVKWDHSVTWFTPLWKNQNSFGDVVTVNLSDEKYSYLEGHTIDGRILMPAMGYLEIVWRVLASKMLRSIQELPVVVENVKFKRATVLPPKEDVHFLVNIMKQSGNFEIFEGGSVVASGKIWVPKDISSEFLNPDPPVIPKNNYLKLTKSDLYKECRLRRYLYKDLFQGIKECDVFGVRGKIEWKEKFTSFLDTMLHLSLMKEHSRDLLLPTSFQQLIIDPVAHLRLFRDAEEISIFYDQNLNVVKSGGIEIVGLEYSRAPRRQQSQADPFLETYEFISYESFVQNQYDFDTSLRMALQIIIQNCTGLIKRPNICEVVSKDIQSTLIEQIKDILDNQIMTEAEYFALHPDSSTDVKYDTLVISENVLEETNLKSILENLSGEGFLLYKGEFTKIGKYQLQIVFQSVAGANSIYLLRPSYPVPKEYQVLNVRNTDFGWLERIKEALQEKENQIVYLFSQGEDVSGIVGLARCLLTEPNCNVIRSVFIKDEDADKFSVENEFYQDQLAKNLTFNVLRNGVWGTFVHLPLKETENKVVGNASTTVLTPGDLSTLRWVQRPNFGTRVNPKSDLVYVFYSSLNFKDVMLATGKLQSSKVKDPTAPEVGIGLEYSGITSYGKRVMGLLGYGALSLQVQTDPAFTWEVPQNWTLKEAATVPCVYATCYYAMLIRGQMRRGESILVHAGSGGIGIAAISIALSMNCTVYTTVGSQEKREYLKKIFPQLKDENIGNSRGKSFEKMIMRNTKGRGVDLVLNSLSAELFQASLRCVGRRGRFLEIGKVDFFNGTPIDSKIFLKNCSFHGILLDDLFESYTEVKQNISDLLKEGIVNGTVKPLPTTVFDETETEAAFRYLSSGKHKGKVVIQIRNEDLPSIESPVRSILAIPKLYFDPNKSYVLIGGLGGFGLELVSWMIKRGATKFVLNSIRNVSNGYQSLCLKKWSYYENVLVTINTEDTSRIEGARNVISAAKKLGPVGGIFNMAIVLKDTLIVNQTKENFKAVFEAKIVSGQNLDTVTRTCCPNVDHFVVFSSVACGRGNTGQSNYGMANSALERLCEKRRRDKLPGVAIQWGPVGDVGVVAEVNVQDKVFGQMLAQSMTSCLDALETFMLQSAAAVGSSVVVADKNHVSSVGTLRTPAEAVAHILGIKNIDLVDNTATLSLLGLDSLMVAEIKQTMYRNYQVELDIDEIRDLTFDKLHQMAKGKENIASIPQQSEVNGGIQYKIKPMIAKEPVVKLNNSMDCDKNVFIVHPIEGHVDILRDLSEQLRAVVYGLQCTSEANYDVLQDYASYFIKQVRNVQPTGPYLLCGYSYGGVLAFEMGLQLEKEGEEVLIVVLDGSPQYMKNTLEEGFVKREKSVDKSKTAVLSAFSSNFDEVNQDKVNQLLENTVGWEKQLQSVSAVIAAEIGTDVDDVAVSADRYFKRIRAGYYYEPSGKLKGKLVLIRRDDNPYLLSDDYEFQKVCQQNVEVLKLRGDHRTILLGDNTSKISEIINSTFI